MLFRVIASILLAVSIAILAVAGASASNGDTLQNGSFVRVSGPLLPETGTIGTLREFNDDSLIVYSGNNERLAIPRQNITRLEIRKGVRTRAPEGAVIGLGVAWAALSIWGTPVDYRPGRSHSRKMEIVGGAWAGALLGAIIGSLWQSPQWQQVSIDPLPQANSSRGLLIRLTLRL